MTPDSAPEVDLIILSYLDLQHIEKCLDSVLASTYPNFRVLVADNGSGPEVLSKLKQRCEKDPRVSLIENGKNLGFAAGNNAALKLAKGKYSVVLNNDTIVERRWLEPMVDIMERNSHLGACQPKILDIKDPGRFEYAGAAGGFIDRYGYPFLRGRIFDTVEADNGQYDDNAELDWCSGAAFMVRNSVLKEVGFFDPIFFMYAEENDLCWRMKKCGYKIVFVFNSVVYHTGMGSVRRRPLFKLHLNYRNCIILLLKNLTLPELVVRLPVRILLDFINAVFFLVDRPFKFRSVSILWAYLELFLLIPAVARSRHDAQILYKLHSNVRVGYPSYEISAVYRYFILKRRTFNQLIARA